MVGKLMEAETQDREDEKFPLYRCNANVILKFPSAEKELQHEEDGSLIYKYDFSDLKGYSLLSGCYPDSVGANTVKWLSSQFAPNEHKSGPHRSLGSKSFGNEPPEMKLALRKWLPIILTVAGFSGCVISLLPYDIKDGVRVPKLSIFKISESMFQALILSDMFTFCGSLVGVHQMHKKPKLAIFSGYVAAVSMLFALAILALFTVIWAFKQI